MSTTPSVKIGFGFILDVKNEDFEAKLNTAFPERVRRLKEGFAPTSMKECFRGRYPKLAVAELNDADGKFTQVVVYSDDRWQELSGNDSIYNTTAGALYPEDVDGPDTADFQKFMDDFGITHPPKIVVWTHWE